MSNLDRLIDFLNTSLSKHAAQPRGISGWLEKVRKQQRCVQLAACMGVDLITDPLVAPVIAELVGLADNLANAHGHLSASELFQLAMDGYPQDRLLCARAIADEQAKSKTYARVLDFVDFLDFYAPYKATTPAETEKARRIYPDGTSLGFVRVAWRGRLPVVWVTDHEQLVTILNSTGHDSLGTRIARRFGLNKPTNTFGLQPQYVAIKYPQGVPEPAYKPTFMDQVWNADHRFVSSNHPDWGETLPFSPDDKGVPERVHPAIAAGLTDAYVLLHLGQCLVSEPDSDVAERALQRFIACLDNEKVLSGSES